MATEPTTTPAVDFTTMEPAEILALWFTAADEPTRQQAYKHYNSLGLSREVRNAHFEAFIERVQAYMNEG